MAVQQNDDKVMADLATGIRSSYIGLCRRYSRRLCNLVYWWLGDWQIAESTAYDTLFDMFREIVDGEEPESDVSFRINVFRCAIREANRRLRAQRGLSPPTDEDFFEDEEAVMSELIEGEASKPPTTAPERYVANHAVEDSLLRMKGEQRLALLLSAYCGFSYREIADVMGRSEENVGQWLFRARRRMGALAAHRGERGKESRNAV